MRPGVPCLIGAVRPAAARVLRARARQVGAPAVWLEREASWTVTGHDTRGVRLDLVTSRARYPGLRLGLLGRHQAHNAALAVLAAERLGELGFPVPRAAIRAGLAGARWPGRCDYRPGRPGAAARRLAHRRLGARPRRAARGALPGQAHRPGLRRAARQARRRDGRRAVPARRRRAPGAPPRGAGARAGRAAAARFPPGCAPAAASQADLAAALRGGAPLGRDRAGWWSWPARCSWWARRSLTALRDPGCATPAGRGRPPGRAAEVEPPRPLW